MPAFESIMVFSFGTTITISSKQGTLIEVKKVMAIGPVKQPIDYTLPPGAEMLVANFKPGAFHGFFGQG